MKRLAFRIFTALITDTGLALTIGNAIAAIRAQLTGMGTEMLVKAVNLPTPPESIAQAYQRTYAAEDLLMGILLIFLGLFLHALMMAREERNVPIKVIPHTNIKTPQWFWMEIRV